MNARVSVLLPLAVDQPYEYRPPEDCAALLSLGQFVKVPLRNKERVGVVWTPSKTQKPIAESQLRRVIAPLDVPKLTGDHRAFIDWAANYILAPKGSVLKLTMNTSSVFKAIKVKKKNLKKALLPLSSSPILPPPFKPDFSAAQMSASDSMRRALDQNKFKTLLLDGVTGSGKTEICFDAILAALDKGRQALMMLPEIALTSYMLDRFKNYSGIPASIWHSGLSMAARRQLWLDVAHGKTRFVIGARSALFLPFQRLGLIIVDEEHDEGFKQEDGVIYHARDMAIVRGSLGGFPVLLSSATPCLETLANIKRGRIDHLILPRRARKGAQPPEIVMIDLRAARRASGQWIAPELTDAIKSALARKEQALLFLNRRGYAPLVLCRQCGHRFACPDCDVWLAEHRARGAVAHELLCHHCGFHQALPPVCPQCDAAGSYAPCGPGVERIFEEVQGLFPSARTVCLSRDLPPDINARRAIIDQMAAREIDILIGTQMIAKGLDFPHLTVAGMIDADLGLAHADLRACERNFQLLQQVAGRTGRDRFPGRAFLQTHMPDHPVMQALAANDRARFLKEEIAARRQGGWPPYGRLAAVILSGIDRRKVQNYADRFAAAAPRQAGFHWLGPAPAPIFRRQKRYRIRFLVKAQRSASMQDYMRQWIDSAPLPPHDIRRAIDVDPHSFL